MEATTLNLVKTNDFTAYRDDLIARLEAADDVDWELEIIAREIDTKYADRYEANPYCYDGAYINGADTVSDVGLDIESPLGKYVYAAATASTFDSIIDEFQNDDNYRKHLA